MVGRSKALAARRPLATVILSEAKDLVSSDGMPRDVEVRPRVAVARS
jgi:hypothetical protein